MDGSGAVFLIDLFEIDEVDGASLALAWEAARAFLQSKDQFLSAELYRALPPHARFRFGHIVEVESVDTWRQLIGDPDFPLPEFPLDNHPGLYEVAYTDEIGRGGVVVVNAFAVPTDADDASFTTPWRPIHHFMASRPGHRGARLLRCVGAADFRYVTIANWQTEDAFAQAIQAPEFAEVVAEMPYETHTGVYEIIRS